MDDQITTKPFRSRRQQRWAFSTGQPFAERWAKQTDFTGLPEKKDAGTDAGAQLHGPGGLLATPGLGTRKGRKYGKRRMRFKAANYSARAGQTIVGNLRRGSSGKFESAGASPAPVQRGIQFSRQPAQHAPPTPKAPKAPKGRAGGKGKGRAAKPKKTEQQRAAEQAQKKLEREQERTAQQQANQDKVLTTLGISDEAASTLLSLAMGEGGGGDDFGLVKQGLVERDRAGNLRLSGAGRAFLSAAQRGDAGGAQSAMSRGADRVAAASDRTTARTERQTAAQQRQQQAADRRAQIAARRAAAAAAKKKKKKQTGGGKTKPNKADRATLQETAQSAGLSMDNVDALARAGRGEAGLTMDVLRPLEEAGLTSDGAITPAGRQALIALSRGDTQALAQSMSKKEWDGEERIRYRLKHGHHDQSTHGNRTGRRMAYHAAYREARAGGASPQEARGKAKDASAAYAAANKPERASAAPKPAAKATGEETRAYGADPNQSYTMQHRVVDMGDIQASNTMNGAINPNYDPALQPRDRSRAASQAQIDQVARQMNPDVLVTDFHRIDAGSPIIDAHGNVLSGNGRTLALQRAAELYPEQYAAYKKRVAEEASALGIDPAAVAAMKNPVLVRELKGETDTAAFAREANSSGTLRMSPLEQAKVDANVLNDRQMLKLHVEEGQDIDRALRDSANKPFIHEFLSTVPENERANLLTRSGDLNQMGLYRMKAAIYTKAFPGEAGSRMAESMLESLDPEVKSIQNGISASLPSFTRATSLTRSGAREHDLDISDDMAKTIDAYARIKDNPALTAHTPADKVVAKYLGQSTMFGRELTPDQERLLVHIDKISRKPTAMRDFLNRYAKIVEDQPQPGQSSLFGDVGRLTRAQLYDLLLGPPESGGGYSGVGQPAPQQPGMFG